MYCEENVAYIYDGSYEGFLCCVFESFYSHCMPVSIFSLNENGVSLWVEQHIETDKLKATRVQASFVKKLGTDADTLIKTVYLSCHIEKELAILRFLHFAYKVGPSAIRLVSNELVAPLLDASRHLHNEKHLLLGFLRFIDIGDALVAFITPKNYILPFIKYHFCTRFANEQFLIYDKTHKAALIYKDGNAQIVDLESLDIPEISEEEALFQALWKRFYNTIAIKARTNERLRMSHMPKRYWENMHEVMGLL